MRYVSLFSAWLLMAALMVYVVGCGDGDSSDSSADSNNTSNGSSSNDENDDDSDTDDSDTDDSDADDSDADNSDADDNASSGDGEWGNLIVTFRYDGTVEPTPIVADGQDAAYCNKEGLVKEDLVVNADNQGIANVVAWLSVERNSEPPAAHPSNEAAKAEPVILDNIDCRFEPHLVIVQTGQTLIVKNSDDIGHNAKANLVKNVEDAFSDNLPAGAQNEYTFSNAESLPMIVECTAHKWMSARLFILDHPFVGKSDADGRLVIPNLPVGTHTIRFNHEKAGNLRGVTIGGEESTRRGEIVVEIEAGDNDLGVVVLDAATFE